MKFERTQVSGFENALWGARAPMASWRKIDSAYGILTEQDLDYSNIDYDIADKYLQKYYNESVATNPSQENYDRLDIISAWLRKNGILSRTDTNGLMYAFIGPNDLDLAQRLCKAGSEHRKFLRQIQVSVAITAPIFWLKEFDTYKLGTTSNSTSTMHKLASTPITIDCFEIDDYENLIVEDDDNPTFQVTVADRVGTYIDFLESLRQKYNETKDKRYWKELIRWLPESWLQTRMITMNYENVRNICAQRQGHRLTEWAAFIDWAKTLPYADVLIFDKDVKGII